jgi:hypothetical protein
MARHEITGRKPATTTPPRVKRTGKSVEEFCASLGISRSTFEVWRRRGLGPAELQPIPGGRIIITDEAEAAWKARVTGQAAVLDA